MHSTAVRNRIFRDKLSAERKTQGIHKLAKKTVFIVGGFFPTFLIIWLNGREFLESEFSAERKSQGIHKLAKKTVFIVEGFFHPKA